MRVFWGFLTLLVPYLIYPGLGNAAFIGSVSSSKTTVCLENCDKIGTLTISFDPGTIILAGDWITLDFSLGVTSCETASYLTSGQASGNVVVEAPNELLIRYTQGSSRTRVDFQAGVTIGPGGTYSFTLGKQAVSINEHQFGGTTVNSSINAGGVSGNNFMTFMPPNPERADVISCGIPAAFECSVSASTTNVCLERCDNTGSLAFIIGPGTTIQPGDWIAIDLPTGITNCQSVDYAATGQPSGSVTIVGSNEIRINGLQGDGRLTASFQSSVSVNAGGTYSFGIGGYSIQMDANRFSGGPIRADISSGGTSGSNFLSFSTTTPMFAIARKCSGAPEVKTGDVSSSGPTFANLSGIINPKGYATTYYFKYWSDNSNETTAARTLDASFTTNSVSEGIYNLLPGTLYYYQLCADNHEGNAAGLVKNFQTVFIPLFKPINPTPEMHAETLPVTTGLQWENGGGATSYDIYFGTSPALTTSHFVGNTTSTTYSPTHLDYGQTYYWRVDARDSEYVVIGDTWSFSTEQALFFGHVACDQLWQTSICIVNPNETRTLCGTLFAYDQQGQQVGAKVISLPIHGRREMEVSKQFAFPGKIRYMVYKSDFAASGYTTFLQPGKYRASIPAATKINSGNIYVPHVTSDENWWTGICLLNTMTTTKEVTIQFNNGTEKRIILGENAQASFTIEDLFGGMHQPDIHSAIVKNGNGLVALQLFGSNWDRGSDILCGMELGDKSASNMFFPHVVSDATWWTGVVAYNPNDLPVSLTISPYTDEGVSYPVQTIQLAAKEKYIGAVDQLALPVDTAWLQISSTYPVSGFELFGTRDWNRLAGYTVVNKSGKNGIFSEINKKGWKRMAFVNTQPNSANVRLNAYNDNGDMIASESIVIEAYSKRISLPAALFTADIAGATHITYTSDRAVVGFQLNESDDNLLFDAMTCLP